MAVAARWQLSWEGSVQEVEALKAVWSLLHTCCDGVPDLDIIWQHFTSAQALLPTAVLQYAHWLLSVECTKFPDCSMHTWCRQLNAPTIPDWSYLIPHAAAPGGPIPVQVDND